MFPGAAWIYLAYKFLGQYEKVSSQVLFSSDGAKIGVVIIVLCYKSLMIVPKVTLMILRDILRHKLSNHYIKL
jgi:hypothetical protein